MTVNKIQEITDPLRAMLESKTVDEKAIIAAVEFIESENKKAIEIYREACRARDMVSRYQFPDTTGQ